MANFLFWLANHNKTGQRSLEDVIGIFGHQLRALGHRAVWDPANEMFYERDQGINVIVEGFNDEVINVLSEYHAKGCRFLMLATEEPGEKGFNQGTQLEMVQRQRDFPAVAGLCEGILHLVPGDHVTRWYSQFAPAAPIELGFAPTLVRNKSTDIVPDFDFGFFGSLTPRRLAMLKRLARKVGTHKAVRVVSDFATQEHRDAEMRRAKVIVQIRKFEEMGLVSSSRCNTSLCIGRPVVAEPHLLSDPWDKIVRFSSTPDNFYDLALFVRGNWKAMHVEQFDKFKMKLSPDVCVGRALAEIGFKEQVAA